MGNLIEKNLIELAIKGDEIAFETLVKNYLKMIYVFAYRYTKNQDDAEDITQEVFVKIWKNLRKFDKNKSFKTWIYKIAKNTCLDFLKKKSSIPFSSIDLKNIEDIKELKRNLPDLKLSLAVKTLSQKSVEIISLYHDKELNFREISKIKGESINTIKSTYRRSISKLKNFLKDIEF